MLTPTDFEMDFEFVHINDSVESPVLKFSYRLINEPGVRGGRIFSNHQRLCDVAIEEGKVRLFTGIMISDYMSGEMNLKDYKKIEK